MSAPAYLQPAPWRPVTVPVLHHRAPEQLDAIVGLFHLDSPDCPYRPTLEGTVNKTFCNRFVSDVTRALGCEVPGWGYAGGALREWQVLEQRTWLTGEGVRSHGWERLSDGHVAQGMADAGMVAIALWQGPTAAHGHIALVIPAHEQPGVWVAQAGAKCFSRGRVESGFGSLPVEYFGHP